MVSHKLQHHFCDGEHGHTHGVIDAAITTTERGIWAVKLSFVGLMVTALFQLGAVLASGSVALLADTIHNFGDASTAIPLWFAFRLARLKPGARFTHGLGRVEDLAGILIVLTILFSGLVAGYHALQRFIHPEQLNLLWSVAIAGILGFAGNEAVAVFRIRVGREINSAALIADGYHARVDGLTSLGVLVSAGGVWLGFPLADPIIGLLITATIFKIVWDSAKTVFTHLLDGVEPSVLHDISHAASGVPGVSAVRDVRARWVGHRVNVEMSITVVPGIDLAGAHAITKAVEHQIAHRLGYLGRATVHIDPPEESGERFHRIAEHSHDGLPVHSH